MKITIPSLGRSGQKRKTYKSSKKEYKDFIPFVDRWVYDKNLHFRVEIDIKYPFKQCSDIDNALKPILDSLKGKVIYDDRQIKHLKVNVSEETRESSIEIKITVIEFI